MKWTLLLTFHFSSSEQSDDGGSDDDKDIEPTEDADKEADPDLPGRAALEKWKVLGRPRRVGSRGTEVPVAPGFQKIVI